MALIILPLSWRGSPKHVTLTKPGTLAHSTPGFPCRELISQSPLSWRKTRSTRGSIRPPFCFIMKNRRTESESDCAISLWTRSPRGTSVAHVCLRVNKVQLWLGHAIKSRSSVVLRLWDRSAEGGKCARKSSVFPQHFSAYHRHTQPITWLVTWNPNTALLEPVDHMWVYPSLADLSARW